MFSRPGDMKIYLDLSNNETFICLREKLIDSSQEWEARPKELLQRNWVMLYKFWLLFWFNNQIYENLDITSTLEIFFLPRLVEGLCCIVGDRLNSSYTLIWDSENWDIFLHQNTTRRLWTSHKVSHWTNELSEFTDSFSRDSLKG